MTSVQRDPDGYFKPKEELQATVDMSPTSRQVSNANEVLKHSPGGIVLVPQPSHDPDDPLNWSLRRKVRNLAIVSLASFIGLAQALTNQSGFFVQGAIYHKTAVQLSYSVSGRSIVTFSKCRWTALIRQYLK